MLDLLILDVLGLASGRACSQYEQIAPTLQLCYNTRNSKSAQLGGTVLPMLSKETKDLKR